MDDIPQCSDRGSTLGLCEYLPDTHSLQFPRLTHWQSVLGRIIGLPVSLNQYV